MVGHYFGGQDYLGPFGRGNSDYLIERAIAAASPFHHRSDAHDLVAYAPQIESQQDHIALCYGPLALEDNPLAYSLAS